MTAVNIIIPVENIAEVKAYYRDIMLFFEDEGEFLLPVEDPPISLQVMAVTWESMQRYPPKKNFPIFAYELEKNFLSYCWVIYQNGGLIDEVFKHEEGYYARVRDPADNVFEISCMSFDDDIDVLEYKKISEALNLVIEPSRLFSSEIKRDTNVIEGKVRMQAPPRGQIILPVDNYDEARMYYRDILSFVEIGELFFLPLEVSSVSIKLKRITEQERRFFPSGKRYMSFSYKIQSNFLSYCLALYKKGAIFDMACETPGGYFARICDPAGNQFEIFCDNFDEDNNEVSSEEMPFFFRY
ncbi:hypothetical protein [Pseudoduganella albidiflava]|uniref:VOC domain-containing protein n=1 Tax=Pseudoduganella albidiflava TaxID=321983 RepID=A0A411WRU4_9BURK|nr:hypothetical protein [Pseudoduganella albidiflava]QBH99489.1 hypothetical protein EYF70_00535 [Pseudoduganella albidiflava]GGY45258.1 hypothetical protein GCM10007387_29070 [Pseudoduganella albidiflava]